MLTNNILLIQIAVSHYGYIVTFNATFVIYLPRSDVVILLACTVRLELARMLPVTLSVLPLKAMFVTLPRIEPPLSILTADTANWPSVSI